MSQRSVAFWFVTLLVVLNSQVIFFGVFNPVYIRWTQELFYVLLMGYTGLIYLPRRWASQIYPFTDIALLFLIFGAWLSSAVFAYLMYGQPLYFGLMEDRRILAGLIYFPIVDAIRARAVSTDDVLKTIFYSALLCGFLSLFVDPIESKQVGDRVLNVMHEANKRAGRITIGVHYMAIACIILTAWATLKKQMGWYAVISFLLSVLFFVAQSRLVFMSLLVALVLMHVNSLKYRVAALFVMASLVVVAFVFQNELATWVIKNFPQYAELFGSAYLEESARGNTLGTIFDELKRNFYVGHGALSLQWNNGFHRMYGHHFFLADVGYAGVLFRYGFFAPIFVLTYMFVLLRLFQNMPKSLERRFVVAGMVYILMLSITQAPLEYQGSIAGLVFAIGEGCRYIYAYKAIKQQKLKRIERDDTSCHPV